MDYGQALILSVVEGITEFLPVSSTGHLILTTELLRIPHTEFTKSFEVIIQLGGILAVVALYWKILFYNRKLWPKIAAAFLPTAIIGFALYKFIKQYLLGNSEVTLWALFIGGILLILWEFIYKEQSHHLDKIENLSYKRAFVIGVAQSLSVIPGVSRSAASIIGGLSVGLKRKPAVEMSFFLAIPTMMGATGLDLAKSSFQFTPDEWGVLAVGFIGSFVTAVFAVKYFLRFITNHTFIPFGIYRILVALLFWWIIIL